MQPLRTLSRAKTQKMSTDKLNKLSNQIIGLAIEVHKNLGPGFVEKIYEGALSYELKINKVKYKRQFEIQVKYKAIDLGKQRVDFLIEDNIILELKSVSEINNIHQAQLLSYLKSSDKRLGLILNFSKPKLEIKRMVYNL